MSKRLKLIVSYDGKAFAGWQSQANGNAIQDRVENAFQQITGEHLRVHGAGRTDAGVHALGQCAHVDLIDVRGWTPARWQAALNGLLPATIRIERCGFVSQNFHARFSAIGKTYRYRVWNGPVLSPLENGRAWHIPIELDIKKLRTAAEKLVGEHDFAGFAANRGTRETHTVRTIHSVRVRRAGSLMSIDFEGSGFLYKMVRMLAGILVEVGLGKSSGREIPKRLRASRKLKSKARLVAPAHGLYLVRVRY